MLSSTVFPVPRSPTYVTILNCMDVHGGSSPPIQCWVVHLLLGWSDPVPTMMLWGALHCQWVRMYIYILLQTCHMPACACWMSGISDHMGTLVIWASWKGTTPYIFALVSYVVLIVLLMSYNGVHGVLHFLQAGEVIIIIVCCHCHHMSSLLYVIIVVCHHCHMSSLSLCVVSVFPPSRVSLSCKVRGSSQCNKVWNMKYKQQEAQLQQQDAKSILASQGHFFPWKFPCAYYKRG